MNKPQGFTLLEVLITLFLLSLLILAITAAQVTAQREARGALYFHHALLLAENMAEYLTVHGGDVARYEKNWRDQINQVLPDASGSVSGAFPDYRVYVAWGGSKSCDKNSMGVSGCCVINLNL